MVWEKNLLSTYKVLLHLHSQLDKCAFEGFVWQKGVFFTQLSLKLPTVMLRRARPQRMFSEQQPKSGQRAQSSEGCIILENTSSRFMGCTISAFSATLCPTIVHCGQECRSLREKVANFVAANTIAD